MSAQQSEPTTPRTGFPGWPLTFALIALEALAAALILANLPADPGGRFLGLSGNRLLLLGLLLLFGLAFTFLAARACKPGWLAGWVRPDLRNALINTLFVLLPLVALACFIAPLTLLSLYRTSGEFRYFAYYERMLPLFAWAWLASLEIFGGLFWSGRFQWQIWKDQRSVFQAGIVIWGLMSLIALFVALTGIGVVPDRVGWGPPTVSLMEWQIGLAWVIGIAVLVWMANRGWHARNDWLLAGAIWLLAAGLWLSQPILPAFFATAGRAPNFEIYPFSDGAYYDHFAQSVLIGNGFKGGEIPARPMYVTLLAGFHLLAGQKYADVVMVQTLLLAFFPVVLFFLGKALHSRAAGVMIALLAVLREVTAINAMPITDNASNSKLFFADLPAALAVSLWVLAAVLWLKAEGRRPWLPFLVGGSMGAAMLFRTQSMFMLPGVMLLALLVCRWNWSRWLRAVGLVGLGLALTLAPYLWRNWAVTGRLVFDDDKSQTGAMAQRYSLSGTDDQYAYRPGEVAQEYSRRITQGIFDFLWTHPGVVAGFVGGHWINAEIDNLLVLPIRFGIADPRELLAPLRPTWQDWNGTLESWQLLLFLVNIGIISLGVGAAWARAGWPGLAPLLANLSYNASNALARNSGGRYLLVVDWVTLIYFAMGLLEIAIVGLALLRVSPERIIPLLARRGGPDAARTQQAQRSSTQRARGHGGCHHAPCSRRDQAGWVRGWRWRFSWSGRCRGWWSR